MLKVPRFHLARVLEDGTIEAPEILPVTCPPWDVAMNRRGALGAGLAISAVLAACKKVPAVQAGPGSCEHPSATGRSFRRSQRIVVSPDGKRLLTGSMQDGLAMWSLPEGERVLHDPEEWATGQAAFSADGALAVTTGQYGEKAFRARTFRRDGAPVGLFDLGPLWHITLSPRGDYLLATKHDTKHQHSPARLFKLPEGKRVEAFEGPLVRQPIFTPDGKHLVFEHDSKFRLWSLDEVRFEDVPLRALARSRDGALLVTESGLTLETIRPGAANSRVSLECNKVDDALVSPSNKVLFVRAEGDTRWLVLSLPALAVLGERTFHFWNRPTEKGVSETEAIAPDDSMLVMTTPEEPGDVRVWSLPGLEHRATFEHSGHVGGLLFTPDSRTLITRHFSSLAFWSLSDGKFRDRLELDSLIEEAVLTPDGKHVIASTMSRNVAIVPVERPCDRKYLPAPSAVEASAERVPPWERKPEPPAAAGGYTRTVTSSCSCNKVCTCIPVAR